MLHTWKTQDEGLIIPLFFQVALEHDSPTHISLIDETTGEVGPQ